MLGLKRLLGCEVRSRDTRIGEVTDLLVDEATWAALYMAVQAENLAGRALLPVDRIRSSDAIRRSIEVDTDSAHGAPISGRARSTSSVRRIVASLRSVKEIAGRRISSLGGPYGVCVDLLADPDTWTIPYLVVNTKEWTPNRHILIPSAWVRRVGREEIQIDAQRAALQRAQPFAPASHDACYSARKVWPA